MKTTFTILLISLHVSLFSQTGEWTFVENAPNPFGEAIFMTTSSTVFAATLDSGLEESEDFGESWTTISFPGGEDIEDLFFTDQNTGYALLDNSIWHSNDGGGSWALLSTLAGNMRAFVIDGSTIVAVGEDGLINYSTDGGESFLSHSGTTFSRLEGVGITSSGKILVVGESGAFLSSSNNGDSWSSETPPGFGDLKDISCVGTECWIVSDNGEIFYSSDEGVNWANQASGILVDFNKVQFLDAQTGFACAEAGNILRTTDGGSTWNPETVASTLEINDMHLFDADHGFAIDDLGLLLRLGEADIINSVASVHDRDLLIFPNPTNGRINIEAKMSWDTFNIRNLLGRELLQGSLLNTRSLDLTGFPAGIYFITANKNNISETIKFIIQ